MTAAFDLPRAVQQTLGYDLRSPAGYRGLLVYLMDLLDWADFRIVEQAASFSEAESTNLVGLRGSYGEGGLLLSTALRPHPSADPDLWTVTEDDPRNATWRDGALYAHGATAGLADLLAKAHAASRVDASDLKRPLILAGLFGASAHTGSVMHLLDSGICAPEMALVGAGTNLELVRSHPGELDVRVEIGQIRPSGASGVRLYDAEYNGPMATDSVSAGRRFDATLRTLQTLREDHLFSVHSLSASVEGRPRFTIATEESAPPAHPHFRFRLADDAGGPALDAVIHAFEAVRPRLEQLLRWHRPDWGRLADVPSRFVAVKPEANGLEFALAHWPLPGEPTEDLLQDLRAEVQRDLPEHLSSRVDVARSVLPFDLEPRGRLINVCKSGLKRAGIPPVVGHHRSPTEAWLLPAYQVDTVVFGPGRQELHGQGNENVPLWHIERAADVYEYAIRRLCCR